MFKIYVGNISYQTSERVLSKLFSTYGLVDEIIYVMDETTGKHRGFAFVLMPDETQARTAIAAMDGRQVNGRALLVTEATKKRGAGGKPADPLQRQSHRPTVPAGKTSHRPMRGALAGNRPTRRIYRRNRG